MVANLLTEQLVQGKNRQIRGTVNVLSNTVTQGSLTNDIYIEEAPLKIQ